MAAWRAESSEYTGTGASSPYASELGEFESDAKDDVSSERRDGLREGASAAKSPRSDEPPKSRQLMMAQKRRWKENTGRMEGRRPSLQTTTGNNHEVSTLAHRDSLEYALCALLRQRPRSASAFTALAHRCQAHFTPGAAVEALATSVFCSSAWGFGNGRPELST